jgi:putative transposase
MHKAFMYRLYPTTKQAEQLAWILDRCRELYNAALEERREAYRMAGKSLSYNNQAGELPGLKDARPEYKQVGSQVLQDVLTRLVTLRGHNSSVSSPPKRQKLDV